MQTKIVFRKSLNGLTCWSTQLTWPAKQGGIIKISNVCADFFDRLDLRKHLPEQHPAGEFAVQEFFHVALVHVVEVVCPEKIFNC